MKQRPDLVGDLAEGRGVDAARVRGRAGDDQLGPVLAGPGRARCRSRSPRPGSRGRRCARRHAVGDEVPDLRRDRGRRPVGQVTTLVEAHGEDRVAGRRAAPGRRRRWRSPRCGAARWRGRRRTAPSAGAARGPRPRRRSGCRRSSAGRGSPRRTCWSGSSRSRPSPPGEAKFSLAISCRVVVWRCHSWPSSDVDLVVVGDPAVKG